MLEALKKCNEEMKRADHLIYVSLKYTRTAEMMRLALNRLINACDYIIEVLLRFAKKRKEIKEIPEKPLIRCKVIEKVYKDDEKIVSFCEFYLFLRKIMKSKYQASKEFRRFVTMSTEVNGKKKDIGIDEIYEFNDKIKEIIGYVKKKVGFEDE